MSARYWTACYATAWVMCLSQPAYAYVDPGTGSMLVQMIIAGAAVGFTVIGLYWSKFIGLIRRHRRTKTPDPN